MLRKMKKLISINLIEYDDMADLNVQVNFDELIENGLRGQVIMELELIKAELLKRYNNEGINIDSLEDI